MSVTSGFRETINAAKRSTFFTLARPFLWAKYTNFGARLVALCTGKGKHLCSIAALFTPLKIYPVANAR